MFPRGLCFFECSEDPVPAQTKSQRQQAATFGAGPLALMLTTKGELECSMLVHPMLPQESLRRNSARRPQPLPVAEEGDEEEEAEEESGEEGEQEEEDEEESAETEGEEGAETEEEEEAEEEGEVKVRLMACRNVILDAQLVCAVEKLRVRVHGHAFTSLVGGSAATCRGRAGGARDGAEETRHAWRVCACCQDQACAEVSRVRSKTHLLQPQS